MKRYFYYLGVALLYALVFAACSKDADLATEPNKPGPPPEPAAKSYIRFNQGSFTVGALSGDETTIEFESNREIFEVYTTPEIDWAELKIVDKKLVARTTIDNPDFATKTAVVYVKAGEGDDTNTASIVLVQMPVTEPEATLTLTPASVSLEGGTNLTQTVAIQSNKKNLTAVVDATSVAWLSATISETTLTLKTLTSNASESDRVATVTVTATGVDKTISKDITVTQKRIDLPTGLTVGAIYQDGMIYSITDNGSESTLMVVSLNEAAAKLAWATDVTFIVSGLSDASRDGAVNTAQIISDPRYPDGFPAAAHCGNMGGDWYMPTRYDIGEIKNSGISAFMGKQVGSTPFEDTFYWTSSPHGTNTANVNAVNPITAKSGNYAKTGTRWVRCVKKVVVHN